MQQPLPAPLVITRPSSLCSVCRYILLWILTTESLNRPILDDKNALRHLAVYQDGLLDLAVSRC